MKEKIQASKILKIEVAINDTDNKIVTAVRSQGIDVNSISGQLEILGILDNVKGIVSKKIGTLAQKEFRH